MLETLLSSQLAYEQIIAQNVQAEFVQPTITIQSTIKKSEPNFLTTKIQNTQSQTSKSSGFLQVLFFNKFKKFPVGEAWELQQNQANDKVLEKISWRSPSYDFEYRDDMVSRSHSIKNTQAIQNLREHLDNSPQKMPGVIGILNRYSPYRVFLAQHKSLLPQSDLCYISGKENFVLYNNNSQSRPVMEIMVDHFGVPENEDIRFLSKIIALDVVIPPYENYYYDDYAIECHLGQGGSKSKSFINLFFNKKNNQNGNQWTLTPVSYSPIAKQLIRAINTDSLKPIEALSESETKNLIPKNESKELLSQVKAMLAQRRSKNKVANLSPNDFAINE